MAVWPYINHMTILAITILPDHMVYVWPYGVWLESLVQPVFLSNCKSIGSGVPLSQTRNVVVTLRMKPNDLFVVIVDRCLW